MVLCELDADDFARFPDLFRERFCREAAAICKQAGIYDNATLLQHLAAMFEAQHYHLDPEPIEEGRITKVFESLERRFLHERQPLPLDGRSAFEFSFHFNGKKPKPNGDEYKPSAAEALGNLCLNLIESRIPPSPVVSEIDNIVRVDFAGQRNRPR